jgi:putative FmdB family regulatory protein
MTYEYVCTSCQHEWEAEQSISEAPLKNCPKCGKAEARRQVSGGAGFILKGGGWYADGYGAPKAESKPAEKAASSPSTPSEGTKSTDDKASKKSGDTTATGSDSKKKDATA